MPNTPKGITYPSSSSPVAVPADLQELATDVDGLIVPNTGGTYTGSVSFTQSPSVPTPTSGLHAVNKTYADTINAKFAKVGNLLTDNQASGGDALDNTTGYVSWQATISRSTAWAAQGTGSILVTATTDHPVVDLCPGGTGGTPVTPGETYTATVDVKAGTAAGRSGELYINWWDAGGAWLSNSYVNWTQSTTPRTFTHTATAPAGAAYASPALTAYTAVAGETFYFDKAGFWRGAGGKWALPGTPILGLEDGLAKVGNLLTDNQASGGDALDNTTGYVSWQATISRSTAWAAQGTGSILVTATTDHPVVDLCPGGTGGTPVTPGETYTATVDVKAGTAAGRSGELYINWWDAGGAWLSNSYVNWTQSTTPRTFTHTATAPAGAAYASPALTAYTAVAGETFYFDKAGFWRGAGGKWQLPGIPIPGQSSIATNDAVHLSGTGTPEWVVSAAPGSTFLQTDSVVDVKGWIKWIKATGTGNTGWVVGPEADTGWRDVSASFTGGYTSGVAYIRRVGNVVQVRVSSGLTPTLTNGAWNTVINLPLGFRSAVNVDPVAWNAGFASDMRRAFISTAGEVRLMGAGATVAATTLYATFTTVEAWPSSLPGTAA